MFHCYVHNWSSQHTMCPVCPFPMTTSTGIDITPIEKVCEKHEPIAEDWIVRDRVWSGTCEHCGVELIAEWRVKE